MPSLHVPLPNASSAVLRPPSHGSGSGWFVTTFLYDSFIRYLTPVYSRRYPGRKPWPRKFHSAYDDYGDFARAVYAADENLLDVGRAARACDQDHRAGLGRGIRQKGE